MARGSRRLRWGVLGAANIALQRFIPAIRAGSEGEVVAIASRSNERARDVASRLDIPRAYGTYESLLGDPTVEAIYLALPNSLHAEWTVRAAEAGKHVLCEKPLTSSREAAERMLASCRKAGVLLAEGFMYRHHPQHARVQELVAQGSIGKPVLLRVSFTFNLSPERRQAGDIRMRRDLDGGALMDVGSYGVNAARYLFRAEPVEVVAHHTVDPVAGIDTSFAGVLRFSDGRLAVVDASFDGGLTQRYEIGGSDGRITVDKAFRPEDQWTPIVLSRGDESAIERIPPANHYALLADHFAASVREGRLLPPAEEGVQQARAIEALRESALLGRAVTLH